MDGLYSPHQCRTGLNFRRDADSQRPVSRPWHQLRPPLWRRLTGTAAQDARSVPRGENQSSRRNRCCRTRSPYRRGESRRQLHAPHGPAGLRPPNRPDGTGGGDRDIGQLRNRDRSVRNSCHRSVHRQAAPGDHAGARAPCRSSHAFGDAGPRAQETSPARRPPARRASREPGRTQRRSRRPPAPVTLSRHCEARRRRSACGAAGAKAIWSPVYPVIARHALCAEAIWSTVYPVIARRALCAEAICRIAMLM